jgi:hypothetical protein
VKFNLLKLAKKKKKEKEKKKEEEEEEENEKRKENWEEFVIPTAFQILQHKLVKQCLVRANALIYLFIMYFIGSFLYRI